MYSHILWIVVFSLNQIAIASVCGLIIHYLKHKPLGLQTLFDLIVKDLLRSVIGSTSVFNFVIIQSQVNATFPDWMLPQNIIVTKLFCLTYYFSYIYVLIHMATTCLVRIISVLWVGYLDDVCGDRSIVRLARLTSLVPSLIAVLIELLNNGIGQGSIYKLLTQSNVPKEFSDGGTVVIVVLLALVIVVICVMQTLIEVQKWKLRRIGNQNNVQTICPEAAGDANEAIDSDQGLFDDTRNLAFVSILVCAVTITFRLMLPPHKRGDFIYLTLISGCEFVAFVMGPARFIKRTPNLKNYAVHKLEGWKEKARLGFSLKRKRLKQLLCVNNQVSPQ